jgi:fructokinase
MIAAGRRLVAQATIVKLSAEELEMLGGEGGVQSLWHDGMKLMAITQGAEGAELFTARHRIICHGFRVEAIDTLACGDAFMATLLSGLLDHGPETGDENTLRGILRRACAAGSLAATRKGAMSSLPAASEIDQLLASVPENGFQAP